MKKLLIFCVIALFICIGFQPALSIDLSISKSKDDLPDYIITKVGKGYDSCADGTFFYIVIKNIGDKKGGWGFTIYIDEYKANLFKPDEKYNHYVIGESGPYGIEPGESKSMRFSWGFFEEHPLFPRYECTLSCDFNEKNSGNNYFEKTYFSFMLFFIPIPYLF